MVIGGVSERGSLFALGLLTVGSGLLVRWLRQQRYEHSRGAGRRSLLGSFPRALPLSVQGMSRRVKAVSAVVGRQWQSAGAGQSAGARQSAGTRPSRGAMAGRSPRGYSAAARPGFRANRFVDAVEIQPRRGPNRRPVRPSRPTDQPFPRKGTPSTGAGRPEQAGVAPRPDQMPRDLEGRPPLNLPPAPRARARRERRIY